MQKILLILALTLSSLPTCWGQLRDPTQPPSFSTMTLNAIMFSPYHQTAIINQQSVQVGDTINGYKLIKIEADKVIMQGSEGALILPLVNVVVKSVSRR